MKQIITTSRFGACPECLLAVRVANGKGWGRINATAKSIMPTPNLFLGYKHGEIGQQEFYEDYIAGLEWNRADVVKETVKLLGEARKQGKEGICFMCYELPGLFCHRHLAFEWLQNNLADGLCQFINESEYLK